MRYTDYLHATVQSVSGNLKAVAMRSQTRSYLFWYTRSLCALLQSNMSVGGRFIKYTETRFSSSNLTILLVCIVLKVHLCVYHSMRILKRLRNQSGLVCNFPCKDSSTMRHKCTVALQTHRVSGMLIYERPRRNSTQNCWIRMEMPSVSHMRLF